MKIDRIVDRLNKKLEEKYPLEVSQDDREGVINTWKGRRVLPVDQWVKMTASLENDKVVFDLSKGFSTFPDSTSEVIFQYGVEGSEEYYVEISKEEFDKWFNDYFDFLTFMKNSELGSMICKNCLLSPHKDRSGLVIGVHKMAAKILQGELKTNKATDVIPKDGYTPPKNVTEDLSIYPCTVLNYFYCPYECKGQGKRFEHEFDSDVQYLFELNQITRLVDTALLKASSMTQSNETIYEIDAMKNTIIEVQTLYNGMQYCMAELNPIEKGLNRILMPSMVRVRNKEDVLRVLKDMDKLDLLLKQSLTEKEYRESKERILRYFEENGKDLELFSYYKYTIYGNKDKRTCLDCGSDANVHLLKSDDWLCSAHYDFHMI